jgi:hypothetical protein
MSTILTLTSFLGGGHQLLDIHQNAAVAGKTDHCALRFGQGSADRRRHAEAHRAEPAGGQPLPGSAQRIRLRNPHLVLTDIGGDRRLVVEAIGNGTDQAVGGARIVDAGHAQRMPGLEAGHARQPVRTCRRLDRRQQHPQGRADVAGDADVCGLDLVEFGRIDVDVDDLRLRAETGHLAGRPVVEAGANGNQQIALVEREVGAARPVHAEHAQRQWDDRPASRRAPSGS